MMCYEFHVKGNYYQVCAGLIDFCYRIYVHPCNGSKQGFVSLKFCCCYNCSKTENAENVDIRVLR